MSLIGSLFSGVSGLRSNSQAMNVIGDNISNTNTVGFKSSKSVFGDLFSTVLTSGSVTSQVGQGTQFIGSLQDFSQGAIENSTNSLDMAIDGQGFFIVNNGQGNFYTRAGQFRINDNGVVQDIGGNILQGFRVTGGTVNNTLENVDLAGVQSAPNASTQFTLGANLDARSAVGTTFTSPITLVNSVGNQVVASITFTKATNTTATFPATTHTQWDYAVSVPAGEGTVVAATANNSGSLVFDNTGTLDGVLDSGGTVLFGGDVQDLTVTIDFTTASPPGATQNITWDLADTTGIATNGKVTGFAATSNNNSVVQDGFPTGVLTGISVANDGTINGLFSNGQSESLFQLGLADFLAPTGLTRVGQNLFAESGLSGQPVIAAPQTGAFGSVLGSTLELSNVDLAQEFVTMIKTQQAFQASARIITTTDDLLTETVNLTR
ncbi:putative Flagellar hook protein flgE [Nitrospina gracilis 3/211]|uniref:Flagellar hook protein FlgE n=1 Tax=Nitrospina gracilis (strain 3/211) TaxID=1266370 RepID=M1YX48_NITG3|nr:MULTISPECIES: flagellar hook protein FlgE [Nitrospina]MCF8723033.1 flagellar hook protein FlgE [Nitrospina sp. Nb-3]CCQ90064.1 putative Flagellar hook protein flgE [Nitrospina gracilis 3/211]